MAPTMRPYSIAVAPDCSRATSASLLTDVITESRDRCPVRADHLNSSLDGDRTIRRHIDPVVL